jgi:hypothetical protein
MIFLKYKLNMWMFSGKKSFYPGALAPGMMNLALPLPWTRLGVPDLAVVADSLGAFLGGDFFSYECLQKLFESQFWDNAHLVLYYLCAKFQNI